MAWATWGRNHQCFQTSYIWRELYQHTHARAMHDVANPCRLGARYLLSLGLGLGETSTLLHLTRATLAPLIETFSQPHLYSYPTKTPFYQLCKPNRLKWAPRNICIILLIRTNCGLWFNGSLPRRYSCGGGSLQLSS